MIKKENCSICNNPDISEIINLGLSPPANNFVAKKNDEVEMYPLIVDYCDKCYCIQLRHCLSESELYSHYTYSTPNASSLTKHYQDILEKIHAYGLSNVNNKCIEIGSNNGNLLKYLEPYFSKVLGVDPAENIAKIAINQGVETKVNFFSDRLAKDISNKFGKFQLGIARHMFAHNNDPKKLMKAMGELLDENGIFIIENAYAVDTFENGEFDQIYHEHMFYYSLSNIDVLVKEFGFEVSDVFFSKVHGGSATFFCSREGKIPIKAIVNETLNKEAKSFKGKEIFNEFSKKIYHSKKEIKKIIAEESANHKIIGAYGAPAKAFTLFSFFELDFQSIKFCVDTTPTKIGNYFPNYKIPVISEGSLIDTDYDMLIVNAWNYKEEILAKSKRIFKKGTKLLFPIPQIEVYEV